MKLPYSKIKYAVAAALVLLIFPAIGEVIEKRQK